MYSFNEGISCSSADALWYRADTCVYIRHVVLDLGSHLSHVVNEVYHTPAVTPLIVVPGHQLHTHTQNLLLLHSRQSYNPLLDTWDMCSAEYHTF